MGRGASGSSFRRLFAPAALEIPDLDSRHASRVRPNPVGPRRSGIDPQAVASPRPECDHPECGVYVLDGGETR